MKKYFIVVNSIIILGLALNHLAGQSEVPAKVKQYAEKALRTNFELIDKTNYSTYGFKELDEINKAKLAEPYEMYYIRLDKLQEYEKEKDTSNLILNSKKFWFPIEVNGVTRLKIEIIDKDGQLITGDFGAARSAQMVGKIDGKLLAELSTKGVVNIKRKSLVQIPSINTLIFMIEGQSGILFVPIYSDADSVEIGHAYNAADIFSMLSAYSQKIGKDIIR
jgi:hypothetical protein